jgi:ubiquitin-protein ligase
MINININININMDSQLHKDINIILEQYQNIDIVQINDSVLEFEIDNHIFELNCPDDYPSTMLFYIEAEHKIFDEVNTLILKEYPNITLNMIFEKINDLHSNINTNKSIDSNSDSEDYYIELSSDDDDNNDNIDYSTLIKKWEIKDIELRKNNSNKLKSNKNIFSSDASRKILINELIVVMKNENNIVVEPVDDNIYKWNIKINKFKNDQLNGQLIELDNKFNYDYLEMEFEFKMDLYPFYPPTAKLIRPRLDNTTIGKISKLDIIKFNSWNPITTISNIMTSFIDIISEGSIMMDSDKNNKDKFIHGSYMDIEYKLLNLTLLLDQNNSNQIINKDKNKNKNKEGDSKHWKSGIGFGYNGRTDWDIDAYIAAEHEKNEQVFQIMQDIKKGFVGEDDIMEIVQNSSLINVIESYLFGTKLLEMDKHKKLYKSIFELLDFMSTDHMQMISDKIKIIINTLKNEADTYINLVQKNNLVNLNENSLSNIIVSIADKIIKNQIKNEIEIEILNENENENENETLNLNLDLDTYISELTEETFDSCDIPENKQIKSITMTGNPSKDCIIRLSTELCSLQSSLPVSRSSSIFLRTDDELVTRTQFIITGPEDTPYSNGCYLFNMVIPNNYPNSPPKILLSTTGNGSVRFNPNLYNCGKVCLSLLGTWAGTGGEKWNSKSSTILQILVSIQSLVFVENPFFNEPSYERIMGTERGEKADRDYNEVIRLGNMQWAILDQLKNPSDGFEDMIKKHFSLKKEEVLKECEFWYNDCYAQNKTKYKKVFMEIQDELNKL